MFSQIKECNLHSTCDCRNPNGLGGGELWPAASMHSREYYELSTASLHNAVYGSGPRTEYCAFWDSYMPGLIKGTGTLLSYAIN